MGPAPTTTTVSPSPMPHNSAQFTAQLTGSARAACSGASAPSPVGVGTLTTWPFRTASSGMTRYSAMPPGKKKPMGLRFAHRLLQPFRQ